MGVEGRGLRYTAIITCMGRLSFLQQTLPELLNHTEMYAVVVDYSCPDRAGDWVEQTHGASGRVVVQRVPERTAFNKCEALNFGAARALEEGLDEHVLVVLDADTRIEAGFWDWVQRTVRPDHFYSIEGSPDHIDLTGVLLVTAEHFVASGGFDERFVGWGAEDLDMRLKLYFKLGLPFGQIPPKLLTALPHEDELRVAHYQQKNRSESLYYNLHRMLRNVQEWTGRDLREQLTEETARLLGVHGVAAAEPPK